MARAAAAACAEGRLLGAELLEQVAEVDHVEVLLGHGAAAEGGGVVAPPADDRGKGGHLRGHCPVQPVEGGHQVAHDGQVEEGHGDGGVVRAAGGDVAGHDLLAQAAGGHRLGLGGEQVEGGVLPAVVGLDLLGGDHVVGQARHGGSHLEGCHEAGIEADDVEAGLAGGVETGADGGGDLGHAQPVAARLVGPDPGDGAMVPEDQGVVVGGVVLDATSQEVGEDLRVAHVELAQVGLLSEGPGGDGEQLGRASRRWRPGGGRCSRGCGRRGRRTRGRRQGRRPSPRGR